MDSEVNNRTCDVIKDGRFACSPLSSVNDGCCPVVAKLCHRSQVVDDRKGSALLSTACLET